MKLTAEIKNTDNLSVRLRDYLTRMTKNRSVLVGIPQGQERYEDGAPLAVIAAVQEFGSADGKVPARSFLRVPIRQNRERFVRIWRVYMPAVSRGEMTMFQFMDLLGTDAVGVSRDAIHARINPANAPYTIEKKGSDTPLIDTGRLWNSINHEVED